MHIRTLDGAGVALMRQGLRPSNQDALFVLDDVVYHRYGMPGSAEEATALGESCRKGRFIVLNNNGLLSIAATAPAALRQLYTLQRTCEWEIDSRRLGQTPVMIQDRIVKGAARRMEKIRTAADYGVVYFEALKRQLVRKGVSDWSR
jgi:ribulose-5-phosphate 4-epimerase/fuculose-1-phosphate aldolase